MRPTFVLIHRYAGLVLAGFLLIAGLTGALLAFNYELDSAINPALMRVTPPSATAQPLPPLLLRDKVLQAYPQAEADWVPIKREPGRAVEFWIAGKDDPVTGEHIELPHDQIFVDPYSGQILGARKWGDIRHGMVNFMPFVYLLHYTLVLDVVGKVVMGVVALLWLLDCVAGIYLTFPAPQRKAAGGASARRSWLSRWWRSWQLRWRDGRYKLNFDLHRAGALWLWLLLLMIAWSSVSFNLPEVYRPVTHAILGMQHSDDDIADLPEEQATPGMPWGQALAHGRMLMTQQAASRGFTVKAESALYYDHHKALYAYSVFSDRDLDRRWGRTIVFFDANNGQWRVTHLATGVTAGDTFTSWITTLHMAAMWGLPWQLVMMLTGLGVALLSYTGVYLWWKKRQGRVRQRATVPAVRQTVSGR